MPNPKPSYERVMLLLPNPLAEFVDQLADQLRRPGQNLSRQDVIRDYLSELMSKITPPPKAASKPARKKVSSK